MPRPRHQQISLADTPYYHIVSRCVRDDKRGAIDPNTLPILKRLNLGPERWCERATAFEETYLDYREPRRRSVA